MISLCVGSNISSLNGNLKNMHKRGRWSMNQTTVLLMLSSKSEGFSHTVELVISTKHFIFSLLCK